MSASTTYDMLITPPHNIEAEQSVLGGLILDNATWVKVESIGLVETDFHREDHRLIFRAIQHLAHNDTPRDILTISDYLKSISQLAEAGGLSYLATMAKDTPSAANISAYARIVREKSQLRKCRDIGMEAQMLALHPSAKPEDIAAYLTQSANTLNAGMPAAKQWCGVDIGMLEVFEELERYAELGIGALLGISTGLIELDQKIAGLEKGKLYLIGGRPSMGKSTLAFNFAASAAVSGKNVAVFSLEMPKRDIFKKLCSSMGGIHFSKLRNLLPMEDHDYALLAKVTKSLKGKSFNVDDTGGVTPAYIRNRLNQLVLDTGRPIDLVVIDYIQLMTPSSGKSLEGNARISEIGADLMAMKKEFDCPFVVLSQLNRNLEQRPNKRPICADLRDSGSLEQDADAIIFVYRDEVYDETTADKGIAELIIAKQRAGELGTIRTRFEGQYQRFANFEVNFYE